MVKIKEFRPIFKIIKHSPEEVPPWGPSCTEELDKTAIEVANEFLATLPDTHIIDVKVGDGVVIVVYKEYTGSNVLFMETTDALINELKRRELFIDHWNRVDIETSVDLFNKKSQSKVTGEEIPKIMEWMYDNLNAEVGVNWDFIDMCIHDYVIERDRPIDYYMHG